MSDKTDDKEKGTRQDPPPTVLEWGMRALSAAIVLCLFGFLTYHALQPELGPNFEVQVHEQKIEQRRNGWAVPFTITNRGTVAIGDVLYEMRLGDTGIAKQGRIAIFGAGESMKGEVWFDRDPRGHNLELRVDTYSL